jgi:hypothetical protein
MSGRPDPNRRSTLPKPGTSFGCSSPEPPPSKLQGGSISNEETNHLFWPDSASRMTITEKCCSSVHWSSFVYFYWGRYSF